MALATERGFLDVVKWLYTEYRADPSVNLCWVHGVVGLNGFSAPDYRFCSVLVFCSVVDAAASKGHLAIVQYLLQGGGKTRNELARKKRRHEAYSEQINRLEVTTVTACTKVAMDVAAANGPCKSFRGFTLIARKAAQLMRWMPKRVTWKWLHANRSEGCTTDAMDGAARYGHLEIVKWLHERRSERCTELAMDKAAGEGHFETLKWLHESWLEGCNPRCCFIWRFGNGYTDLISLVVYAFFGGCSTIGRRDSSAKIYIRTGVLLAQFETVLTT